MSFEVVIEALQDGIIAVRIRESGESGGEQVREIDHDQWRSPGVERIKADKYGNWEELL